ncbi:hypothetical protein AM501_20445 [Aneurinibacillus migulanus]|uniref:GerMN domain-containing protein n=1 Tax=Aneurinibacillus migulanus TaxID=47500 RepID=UPI0005B765D0|nr:GerMN domain-containing protein [Aneurinibacillus migulanus]KIV56049.1 hypothetical protein TS64_11225 [Aneurinibacillus migulanus]KPD06572.1 hypothetical protein AM501_20445 [Aneurinibacillus migulanus]CEH29381.1 Uncharacterized protein BN1090_A2_01808 [Aneurinibacillus migulanus]
MRLPRALLFIALMAMLAITGCTSDVPSSGQQQPPATTNNGETTQPPPATEEPNSSKQPSAEQPSSKERPSSNSTDGEEVKEKKVMLVFSDANLMKQYKEPRTIKYKKEENLPTIALMAWKNGPQNKELTTLMPKNAEVQWLKKEGNTAVISLSPEIKQANLGSSGEQFLLEEMATILSQFGYKDMKVLIDGKEVDTILGHMDTTTPIEPLNFAELKEMK